MYKKNSKGDLDLHPTPNPSLNPAHDNVDTQKQSSAGYRQGGGDSHAMVQPQFVHKGPLMNIMRWELIL